MFLLTCVGETGFLFFKLPDDFCCFIGSTVSICCRPYTSVQTVVCYIYLQQYQHSTQSKMHFYYTLNDV